MGTLQKDYLEDFNALRNEVKIIKIIRTFSAIDLRGFAYKDCKKYKMISGLEKTQLLRRKS